MQLTTNNVFCNVKANIQLNTENSRKNTSDGESYMLTNNYISNPQDAIKSPNKTGKYIDLSARLISPQNKHKPLSYLSTLETQKPTKNSFRKSYNNKNDYLTNNLYNISYANTVVNNNNNCNFNNSSIEINSKKNNNNYNNRLSDDDNINSLNKNKNFNEIISNLQVKKTENQNSLSKREQEIPNAKASSQLNNPEKKNLNINVNQMNLNLIDYNKLKNNTLTSLYSNRHSQEKEIHGILKKSSEDKAFKSRYSLSNGFKDKKVTFQDTLISFETGNNQNNHSSNSNRNNSLHVSSEIQNFDSNQGYNFIDKNVLAKNYNPSNINRNNIYADKNVYNKNINMSNNYLYLKNNVVNNTRKNLRCDTANNIKSSGNISSNFGNPNTAIGKSINENKYSNYMYK